MNRIARQLTIVNKSINRSSLIPTQKNLTLRPYAQVVSSRIVDVRFLQSNAKDAVLEKYKEKLLKKAKQVGASDINELTEKLKDDIEKTKKELNKIDPLKELKDYEAKLSSKSGPTSPLKPLTKPPPAKIPSEQVKTLNSFIDVEKVKKLSPLEIEVIWKARFQNKEDSLMAIIEKDVYQRVFQNAVRYPMFIMPLLKEGQGHEMHFLQWCFMGPNTTHLLITTLGDYQLHGEYARPHTTLMFHHELHEPKGVFLMNGTVEKDSGIKMSEAQLLVLNTQRFYGSKQDNSRAQKRLKMIHDFNTGDPNFKVDELITESETMD